MKTSELTAELFAMRAPRSTWAQRLDGVRELSSMIRKHWDQERERLKENNG